MTESPADRLARVVELWKTNPPGAWNGGNVVAACHFIRDDAPALLAEVARLRARCDAAEAVAAADGTLHAAVDIWQARAEAAEKVAREAVWLLREADTYVRALAALDGVVPRTIDPNSVSGRISALLAHHGAGTGEGNG